MTDDISRNKVSKESPSAKDHSDDKFLVVGLGASAGGIQALKELRASNEELQAINEELRSEGSLSFYESLELFSHAYLPPHQKCLFRSRCHEPGHRRTRAERTGCR
jgi:hypothetical protein